MVKREILKVFLKAKMGEELSLSRLSRETGIPKDVVEDVLSSVKDLVVFEDGKVRMGRMIGFR